MKGSRAPQGAVPRVLALALVAGAVMSFPVASAFAQEQPPTITTSAPRIQWEGEERMAQSPVYSATVGGPCSAGSCDERLIRVDLPPSYWEKHVGAVVVSADFDNVLPANLDVYVYESDAGGSRGALVGKDNMPSEFNAPLPQSLTDDPYVAVPRASGYYLIHVVYAGSLAPTGYVGRATLVPSAVSTPVEGLETLGLGCEHQQNEATSGVRLKVCNGLFESFDGLTLSVRIRVAEAADRPLPGVLLIGACCGNRSVMDFISYAISNRGLAARGYVAVSYSARGTAGSCGFFADDGSQDDLRPSQNNRETELDPRMRGPGGDPTCAGGHMHVAERDFEIRDAQHLLGTLVDLGIADPAGLGALGDSIGGAQAWSLATSLPWDTPAPGRRRIQLSAAVSMQGWTDLQNAVAPNGRAGDRRDQGASHERPHGVVKQSYAAATVQSIHGPNRAVFGNRTNESDPSELHSWTTGWGAFWEAGEPYDAAQPRPGLGFTGEQLAHALRGKSAYYAEAYLDAISKRSRANRARRRARGRRSVKPVPIFAVQGWTDMFFPPVETLQMYRKLTAARPGYPIWMALADIGHANAQAREDESKDIANRLLAPFLDALLKGEGEVPADRVTSYLTECPAGASLPDRRVAADWDAIAPGSLTLTGSGTRTTSSVSATPVEEARTDPLLTGAKCITQGAGDHEDLADWSWDVPAGGLTLLGLPRLRLKYELAGEDATVIPKLWDAAPDGTRTLVTRGVYRISLLGGDAPTGQIDFQLFGNHWRFEPGHRIVLELSQTDAPFLRPDNFSSSMRFSTPRLTLPTPQRSDRKAGTGR